MIIFASEDVGNADPRALDVATSGMSGFLAVGMPEGRLILGQVCAYLAMAPKSNASYMAVNKALACVKESGSLPVPPALRNAATSLQRDMGHGKDYVYPHDHGGWIAAEYLPDQLKGVRFYEPKDIGYERHLRERLDAFRHARKGSDEEGQ